MNALTSIGATFLDSAHRLAGPPPAQAPADRVTIVSPFTPPPSPSRPTPAPAAPCPGAQETGRRNAWRVTACLAALVGLSLVKGHTPPPWIPVEATTAVDPKVSAPRTATVAVYGSHVVHYPISATFHRPVLFERHRVRIEAEIPPSLASSPPVVATMYAQDVHGNKQYTSWADGEVNPGNIAYDPATRQLTLTLRPSPPSLDPQGTSDPGFDPSRGIRSVGLHLHVPPEAEGGFRYGTVVVKTIRVEDVPELDSRPSVERPLLKTGRVKPRPLRPRDVKYGVSRFFTYGDLHRWEALDREARHYLAKQQAQGFDTFRLMGGFDTRSRLGFGAAPGPREMAATEMFLQTAEETGQKRVILTLFDGAIANDVLKKAMTDEAAGKRLIDLWRPYIREFGNRTIGTEPVVFDLVNEIHGMGLITQRQRQVFVEHLMDAFVQEAPNATVTLGVASFKDLTHWTYLLERYQGKPIKFIPTFHVWEGFDKVPPAWELNVPPGTTVGITEADPREGIQNIVRKAAAKGYPWLIFWTDAKHPYSPQEHRAALEGLHPRP